MVKKNTLIWQNCSEGELAPRIKTWLDDLPKADVVIFLEGPMGAGKSTFARAFLSVVCPGQLSKGSPTFPLVHEYLTSDHRTIYHIDLYRLKNAEELRESGIEAQVEEPGTVVLMEWGSLFSDEFKHLSHTKKVITVEIEMNEENRNFRIQD